ncbi:hypothetical protein EYF80_054333 [Liparis tanakae]|uniref:Uncharacterized protein n=1 Tax=Liparis tanakae TaxID=230148 RepID=A0A4Z2F3N7_9TELE|nr:hypothetical protein EYF80_054333 [Liparis tanakae]
MLTNAASKPTGWCCGGPAGSAPTMLWVRPTEKADLCRSSSSSSSSSSSCCCRCCRSWSSSSSRRGGSSSSLACSGAGRCVWKLTVSGYTRTCFSGAPGPTFLSSPAFSSYTMACTSFRFFISITDRSLWGNLPTVKEK